MCLNEMYSKTKAAALEDTEKNKFLLKGRYKSEGGDGIPIGAFNVPRGSVKVTAGGRLLREGIDYTVNYAIGRVKIIDPALQASNIPISISVENNSFFNQQNKKFCTSSCGCIDHCKNMPMYQKNATIYIMGHRFMRSNKV